MSAAEEEDDEERQIETRLRVIYAMDRINRLLEAPCAAGHALPDDTLELVVSCVNAVADLVERRLALDSEEPEIPDEKWDRLTRTG